MATASFDLGLNRWQQQTVDVWVSHHGTNTELFCGATGWRIVMRYENAQDGIRMINMDLIIPLQQRVTSTMLPLVVGNEKIYGIQHHWKMNQLRESRWSVQGHNTHRGLRAGSMYFVRSVYCMCRCHVERLCIYVTGHLL
jgi:hypothetical protein